MAGIPRKMTTTFLTSEQFSPNSRGQIFSSALQSAVRGVAVATQGPRTTAQSIAKPAPVLGKVADAVSVIGSSSPKGIHTTTMPRPEQAVYPRQPPMDTISYQRTLGVAADSAASASVTSTLLVTSPQQTITGRLAINANSTPIAVAASNKPQGRVDGVSVSKGGIASSCTIRPLVAGATPGIHMIPGHPVVMTQASGQTTTTTPSGSVTSVGTSGKQVTRPIVVRQGSSARLFKPGQVIQVTGQDGQQQQFIVSQSGKIILKPSGTTTQQ